MDFGLHQLSDESRFNALETTLWIRGACFHRNSDISIHSHSLSPYQCIYRILRYDRDNRIDPLHRLSYYRRRNGLPIQHLDFPNSWIYIAVG